MKNNFKIITVVSLVILCLFLIYYFHYIVKTDVVFTHVFYLLVVISAIKNQNNITITVSDNGTGITPEILNRLFDASQIITTKGTSGEKGSGIGLLLCKEFVEKHGGKIWAESEEGKGSDFKFTLPMIID